MDSSFGLKKQNHKVKLKRFEHKRFLTHKRFLAVSGLFNLLSLVSPFIFGNTHAKKILVGTEIHKSSFSEYARTYDYERKKKRKIKTHLSAFVGRFQPEKKL
jgi:hypothetical protein